MKNTTTFKVTRTFLKDVEYAESYITRYVKKIISNYKKDFSVQNLRLSSGVDELDFIRNTTTFFIEFEQYKLPRFIKNLRK
jgi:hypothetical protein